MISKKITNLSVRSMKYVLYSVLSSITMLACSIVIYSYISSIFVHINFNRKKILFENSDVLATVIGILPYIIVALLLKSVFGFLQMRASFKSGAIVKKDIRRKIFEKISSFGSAYSEKFKTSEVIHLSMEGVNQLETYFAFYLPQFFYSMIAPLILFFVIFTISPKVALTLLLSIPLIPISIIFIQKIAKKINLKYWGKYSKLADGFLENIQGLTTLKIYDMDEIKHNEMNRDAEEFRKITMKVLFLQLNSLTVMDVIAYGGSAIAIVLAILELKSASISLNSAVFIILLASEFFIPLRQLGSAFHIAMNGVGASNKIIELLATEKSEYGKDEFILEKNGDNSKIEIKDLCFSYNKDREILKNISFNLNVGSFTALVGESGCGKSTIASILSHRVRNYRGSIKFGQTELSSIDDNFLMDNITVVSTDSYLFKGTVRENLEIAMKNHDSLSEKDIDTAMIEALKTVRIWDFLCEQNGLDTMISEGATNVSGGQAQRLCMARAILHNTPIYIFDEATSNIDIESEECIMEVIHEIAKEHTVLMISHRLANAIKADQIVMLKDGYIKEIGVHNELLNNKAKYASLYNAQRELESFGGVR